MSEEDLAGHRLVVGEGFSWEPIPDGCLLFEESTGRLLTLNPAAEAVLAHCDGELTGAEISRVRINTMMLREGSSNKKVEK